MDTTSMREPRRLPVGIQSFEEVRRGGYRYVDKTEQVWRLTNEGKAFFLSRPRRFGKSLLVSTLEAFFHGRRDLFDGLAIQPLEDSRGEEAWTKHPIIHVDLSIGKFTDPGGLDSSLNRIIRNTARRHGVDDDETAPLPDRFADLIETLHERTGEQVVVLVDEYDKPLLDTIETNPALEEENRRTCQSFFGVLKGMDAHLRFVFLTGVTKFNKVSVFSGLNNLKDISLADEYATLCGITQEEMERDFAPEIEAMAHARGMSRAECLDELAHMYDGYHFSPAGEGVYNPFSLLNAFQDKQFNSYWFETGTPTFLIRLLRSSGYRPEDFTDGVDIPLQDLRDYSTDDEDPTPLFYQTGYLTICGYDEPNRMCALRFPNEEVRRGFLDKLAPSILGGKPRQRTLSLYRLTQDIEKGDIDSFMTRLTALFASIPYEEGRAPTFEEQWRDRLFIIFMMLGAAVRSEVHTAAGRADCVVETRNGVYVFEFKLDKSADEALRQIDEKGYATPYAADPRPVRRIGVAFSTATRTIADWKVA